MSKLKIITKAFKENPNIVVYGPHETRSFGEGYSGGLQHDAHTLNYVVAPKVEIASITQMNKWFQSLIPNYSSLSPINDEKFELLSEGVIRIGQLRFDEKDLGTVKTLVTRVERITDEDFLKGLEGFEDGLRVRTEERKVNLGRMIMIYGCPNTENVREVYDSCKTRNVRTSVSV